MRELSVAIVMAVAGCANPVPLGGPHRLYQVSAEHIPTTDDQAKSYGVHEPTETYDQLGIAFADLLTEGFADPQHATDMAAPGWTIDVQQPDGDQSATPAAINSYAGAATAFDPSSPPQPPLDATADHALVNGGPGDFTIVIAPFGMPLVVTLHAAQVQLIAGPEQLQAIIAGGIDVETRDQVLIPSWALELDEIVARDCTTRTPPGCGCVANSPGANALHYFDTTGDCVITADELVHAPLVQSIGGADWTADGQMLLSFGFGVDATYVRTVP